ALPSRTAVATTSLRSRRTREFVSHLRATKQWKQPLCYEMIGYRPFFKPSGKQLRKRLSTACSKQRQRRVATATRSRQLTLMMWSEFVVSSEYWPNRKPPLPREINELFAYQALSVRCLPSASDSAVSA